VLDLNWIDDGTFFVALVYAFYRHLRSKPRKAFVSKRTRKDFLDGTALFPLAVLTLSLFSPRLTSDLLHANKLILSVAGFVAILAVLED
jgi:hypothetical protein